LIFAEPETLEVTFLEVSQCRFMALRSDYSFALPEQRIRA
jgi:hypothetical protein